MRIHAFLLTYSPSFGVPVTFHSEIHELAHVDNVSLKYSTEFLVINHEREILETNTKSFISTEKSNAF